MVFLTVAMGQAEAAQHRVFVDSVYVRNDSLLVDFHTVGLFDRKLVRAVNRGATSVLAYEVRLWRSRRVWADALVRIHEQRAKVFFNHWEQQYVLANPDTSRGELLELDEIMRRCQNVIGFLAQAPVSTLPGGEYYVSVTVVVEPLSVETYQEVQRWLKGEAGSIAEEISKKKSEGETSAKGRLFQLLLDLTGFGDRVFGAKSSPIRLGS